MLYVQHFSALRRLFPEPDLSSHPAQGSCSKVAWGLLTLYFSMGRGFSIIRRACSRWEELGYEVLLGAKSVAFLVQYSGVTG